MTALGDLRATLRFASQHRGAVLAILCVLGTGIGINTALFSVLNAVWLQAVPYSDPSRLALVFRSLGQSTDGSTGRAPVTWTDIERWQNAPTVTFDRWGAATTNRTAVIGIDGKSVVVGGRAVQPAFLAALGEVAREGRLFSEQDRSRADAQPLLITERLRGRLNLTADWATRPLTLDGRPAVVVGIVGDRFREVHGSDVLTFLVQPAPGDPGAAWTNLTFVARLKRTVSAEEAGRLLNGVSAASVDDARFTVVPLRDYLVGANVGRSLFLLLGVTLLVLAAACVNAAIIVLTGLRRRQKEFAIRMALGASRARIAGQLALEGLLLSATTGAIGVLLAKAATKWLGSMMPQVRGYQTAAVDGDVLLFSAAAAIMTTMVVGLVPIAGLSESHPARDLTGNGSTSLGRSLASRYFIPTLLGAQAAVATLVLVVATVVLTAFVKLLSVDPGFDPQNVLTVDASSPYGSPLMGDAARTIEAEALSILRSQPNVVAAGSTDQLPFGPSSAQYSIKIQGREDIGEPLVYYRRVSEGYLEAMRIALVSGRYFTVEDGAGAPPVAIVNERFEKAFFGSSTAIGRLFSPGGDERVSIVGVVRDIRAFGLDREPTPEIYRPRSQGPDGGARFVVKVSGALAPHLVALRSEQHPLRRVVKVGDVQTMDEWIQRSIAEPQSRVRLCVMFGTFVLSLAVFGVGGATARAVVIRQKEIGVRLALGASYARVRRSLVWDASKPVLLGCALGALGSFWMTRSVLVMVGSVSDPGLLPTIIAAALLVGGAIGAALLSGRKVLGIDPALALRTQ
jgi:putative ABC transport system permease protein